MMRFVFFILFIYFFTLAQSVVTDVLIAHPPQQWGCKSIIAYLLPTAAGIFLSCGLLSWEVHFFCHTASLMPLLGIQWSSCSRKNIYKNIYNFNWAFYWLYKNHTGADLTDRGVLIMAALHSIFCCCLPPHDNSTSWSLNTHNTIFTKSTFYSTPLPLVFALSGATLSIW